MDAIMLRSQAPIMKISSLFVCFVFIYAQPENAVNNLTNNLEAETQENESLIPKISSTQDLESIEAGSTPTLNCNTSVQGYIWWLRNGINITSDKDLPYGSIDSLTIKMASRNDTGNYTCVVKTTDGNMHNKTVNLRVIEPVRITGGEDVRVELDGSPNLFCNAQGYPMSNFSWIKISESEDSSKDLEDITEVLAANDTYVTMVLNFTSVSRKDNGTYECRVKDHKNFLSNRTSLIVKEVPQVVIEFVKAVGADSVYLNWTVIEHNDPVISYRIRFMKNGSQEWQYHSKEINGSSTSYIMKGLESDTGYQFAMTAKNSVGESHLSHESELVKTLDKDPEFIPFVSVKGMTSQSLTIGWTSPPKELQDHVQYYKILVTSSKNVRKEAWSPTASVNSHMLGELDPGTDYNIQVAACSEYTHKCGNWSAPAPGTTLDGVPSPPQNVTVICKHDNASSTGSVIVSWEPPSRPNGEMKSYMLVLTGEALFRNDMGKQDFERHGPNNNTIDATKPRKKEFENVPANTNYTVRISAQTRVRISSSEAIGSCTMPVAVPITQSLNMKSWQKIDSDGLNLLKISLPRISERNGPICCYRIFIVKLGYHKTTRDLPEPKDIVVYNYQYAHSSPTGGAYLAEMFDSDQLVPEIFIGNGEASNGSSACHRNVGLRPKSLPLLSLVPEVQPTAVLSGNFLNSTLASVTSQAPENPGRKRREGIPDDVSTAGEHELKSYSPEDGILDDRSNYTGFIEVIVCDTNRGQFIPAYSSYLEQRSAGYGDINGEEESSSGFGILIQFCIALTILVLVLLMGMCVLNKYLKHARQGGEEIISLRNSFRHLCRTLRGRHQLVASNPPDMPPIARSDLLQAYIDRHRDSDYGFQHEFELLPDRFADRTTRASEARENLYKNRYPDIKCYDQTRVRLVQMDGICGSDYINANFVLGYKERKKFICAQGPMENTVCDYWRMIWEQHLELVLMLTNLEEYSKTKCAKYWPDKSESKSFGDITVEHVRERPYSDYVVRELKMTRTGERDSRIIIQHHFLVWKDFMAPEHPHAILRFIKRVNEAYSMEKGPILVHCSAGVGRTGTLVALDSLLQQLAEEGQVSIFNTVCDLRHQRNFLVQSLKQYIFVYRALMEMAQFGDTEIPANQLKNIVDKLRQRENGKDKSKMEEEYEKISSVLEDRKSFSVGGGEENRIKNRNELVIPYDRNRVILTPVPGREHSTYINASFIEGYDNSESFIITQDPIESTIPDFWRMISEQGASTIVMLSDLTEGPRKCPRYWSDDEIAYDHIRVRYIQSESCPYYTRRELCLVNTKTDDSTVVTQYHYHGWPTVEGEVPEVTRGLIELVDQTVSNDVESGGPLVVHCNCGSDRSSMFVALSILVQQLRTERRVDIFTTTKKLRSQRHGMIGSFAQYEFLHRAIVNYSDLHKLGEEDSGS